MGLRAASIKHGWTPAMLALASIALVVCLGSSSPAQAADEHPAAPADAHHDEHAAGDNHHDHAEGGHGHGNTIHGAAPRNYFGKGSEFLYWSPQLFIWTLLLFLPLWFLLQRLVWTPMIAAIKDRDQRISDSLAMAQKLRDDAAKLTSGTDAETIRAQQEARQILEDARAVATREVNDLLAAAREHASATAKAATEEIEQATRSGLAEIERSAESIGASIAHSLVQSGGKR